MQNASPPDAEFAATDPDTTRNPAPRSLWQRVADRFAAMFKGSRAEIPPERSVAFTIAVIALGAKMAKADGRVHRSEVAAFRRVFTIPPSEEKNAGRVFDLARQDIAGFDIWARRIAELFPPGDPVLDHVVEGLVIVATADHELHRAEHDFLSEVARIFAIPEERLAALINRHDRYGGCPPCEILGIRPGTPLPEAQARFRELIRENHPDRAISAGLPQEAIQLAETRSQAITQAWHDYRDGFSPPP